MLCSTLCGIVVCFTSVLLCCPRVPPFLNIYRRYADIATCALAGLIISLLGVSVSGRLSSLIPRPPGLDHS